MVDWKVGTIGMMVVMVRTRRVPKWEILEAAAEEAVPLERGGHQQLVVPLAWRATVRWRRHWAWVD